MCFINKICKFVDKFYHFIFDKKKNESIALEFVSFKDHWLAAGFCELCELWKLHQQQYFVKHTGKNVH